MRPPGHAELERPLPEPGQPRPGQPRPGEHGHGRPERPAPERTETAHTVPEPGTPEDAELERAALRALDAVYDPELDEPVTDLGFVRSVRADGGALTVHLRLPTSFCAPNFAYLMASDAKDVLTDLPGVREVAVLLDDHHDSDRINRGLAADAGYRGTFGDEAREDLEELRLVFRRKAHAAAMERALTLLLRADPGLAEEDLHDLTLADLPDDRAGRALLRRRAALGLDDDPTARVLVDDHGDPFPREEVPLRLRFARSTRISIEGNSHFCRGLLRTRYPGSEADQAPPAHTLPLTVQARQS
ncbi:iron-sulfur cluster assembly protein [Nocardiopsis sp. HUAS JQ3]|uniref:iron-sulfur cluster assembly protein n=1 Tax=Nocardiopsis sp. HUAS JQ3 TaxID=3061629 RepID=UPI0023A9CDDE|nr:iron-sulfur cluster assembly protein [Nocardiopsis sp. HUAS JQ3]WDZ89607.1 iron-sulfur cluster assembly protein [Nocardiopsis sp. HUAS JQ3]